MSFDKEVDWLIAGSGAGGMTGAVAAHQFGAKEVLVVESASVYGGTTALSGGVAWIPGNHLQHTVGIKDSIEEGHSYLKNLIGDTVKPERIRAYAERADEMLKFMHQHSCVSYIPIPTYMDYFEQHEGYKEGGRSMDPGDFSLRKLGDEAQHMRQGHFEGLGFAFSITVLEAQKLLGMTYKSYLIGAKLLLRYWLDIRARLKGSEDDRVGVGRALVAKLRRSLMDRDIPLWLDSPMQELIKEGDRVVGAVVMHKGKAIRIRARQGVLMASGGFAKNLAMREEHHFKPTSTEWTAGSPSSNGDGIRMGKKIGAKLGFMHSVWWSPSYVLPDGRAISIISGKSHPGSIMVGKSGKRFTNEAQPYEEFVKDQYAANDRGEGTIPCYLIFDAVFRNKYSIGHIRPGKIEPDVQLPKEYFSSGLLTKGESLRELGDKLSINADELEKTVTNFNQHAKKGNDPEFGRGETLHDRYYADPNVTPNPTLAALEKGPYYALRMEAGDLDTKGGLVCDEHGRVCDENDKPIVGLYGAGNTSAAVMGDTYPGAGATIGSAMTFAYIAAHHAFAD